jgi:HK97 family phage major capsid protein
MQTILKPDPELNELVLRGRPLDGYENRGDPNFGGFAVPVARIPVPPMKRRDMQAGIFSQGGAFVSTQVDNDVIGFLNPVSAVARMGPNIVTGLKQDWAQPTVTSTASAEFLAEYQQATSSNLAVGQLLLTPHRLAGSLTASKQIDSQRPEFGSALFQLVGQMMGATIDAGCLTGAGGATPLGILATASVGQVTFNSSVWQNLCDFEAAIGNASANVDGARLGWITTPNVRSYFKSTPRASGLSLYLMDDENKICGYRSEMTTALSATDKVVFGNWQDFVLGFWGDSIYFRKNPYSKSSSGEDVYDFWAYVDFGPRHAQSFCVSSGSPL